MVLCSKPSTASCNTANAPASHSSTTCRTLRHQAPRMRDARRIPRQGRFELYWVRAHPHPFKYLQTHNHRVFYSTLRVVYAGDSNHSHGIGTSASASELATLHAYVAVTCKCIWNALVYTRSQDSRTLSTRVSARNRRCPQDAKHARNLGQGVNHANMQVHDTPFAMQHDRAPARTSQLAPVELPHGTLHIHCDVCNTANAVFFERRSRNKVARLVLGRQGVGWQRLLWV